MSDAVQPSDEKDHSSTVTPTQDQATEQPPEEETKKENPNAEGDKGRARPAKVRREGEEQTAENEIRVAAKGQIKNYLGYAFRILNKTDHRSLTIRATGNAIVKALILIELVKRRVGDLHQRNKIYSLEIKTEEEAKIDGLPKMETKRRVTAMDTELSKDQLDENDAGYQKPEPKEEGPVGTQNAPRQHKEGGNKKTDAPSTQKSRRRYNDPNPPVKGGKEKDEEKKDGSGKQRRGRDGKHEDEKDNNQSRKDKDRKRGKKENKGEQDQDRKATEGGEKRQYRNKPSRRENLRNLINDDEYGPKPSRGGRGGRGRGGRGGPPRGGYYNTLGPRDAGRDYDSNYQGPGAPGAMHGNPGYRGEPREPRERYNPQNRSNDDFYVRPANRGRGGRRGGGAPPHMYPGPPRYNYGPPHGYDHYPPHARQYHGERRDFDRERDTMHPQAYGQRGGMPYGGPPRDERREGYGDHPPYRGGRDDDRHPGPRGGPAPRGYGQRPDFDQRGPGPRGPNPSQMRGGSRGGPAFGGARRDDRPDHDEGDRREPEHRDMEPVRGLRGNRGRGGRGRGDFHGERGGYNDHRGRGGYHEGGRGEYNDRGPGGDRVGFFPRGRGNDRGGERGGYRGRGRGGHNEDGEDAFKGNRGRGGYQPGDRDRDGETQGPAPMVHRRARGGHGPPDGSPKNGSDQ